MDSSLTLHLLMNSSDSFHPFNEFLFLSLDMKKNVNEMPSALIYIAKEIIW